VLSTCKPGPRANRHVAEYAVSFHQLNAPRKISAVAPHVFHKCHALALRKLVALIDHLARMAEHVTVISVVINPRSTLNHLTVPVSNVSSVSDTISSRPCARRGFLFNLVYNVRHSTANRGMLLVLRLLFSVQSNRALLQGCNIIAAIKQHAAARQERPAAFSE
jgi:hypothetical protein